MKIFTTIFHKGHHYDPTLSQLFRAFENVNTVEECDLVVMPITYKEDYVFDHELMETVQGSGKKLVVVDFVEYGWDVLRPDHIFGVNTSQWKDKFKVEDYFKLDEFIYRNAGSVVVYFKRELVKNGVVAPFKVLPIEYPGVVSLPDYSPRQTFEEFNSRPIDIVMFWGLSSPSRQILHGHLISESALRGQHLVASMDYLNEFQRRGEKRMVMPIHIPDFKRISMQILLHIQSMAKVSISMGGAGSKCFRDYESSYNSVMARQENPLEWSYTWIDGVNSIKLPKRENDVLIDENKSYEKIMDWLNKPTELYDMYLKGIENSQKYEANNYSKNYILKEIQNAI
jgi:hypothetical protein